MMHRMHVLYSICVYVYIMGTKIWKTFIEIVNGIQENILTFLRGVVLQHRYLAL